MNIFHFSNGDIQDAKNLERESSQIKFTIRSKQLISDFLVEDMFNGRLN